WDRSWVGWISLGFIPSGLMVGGATDFATDIAAIPLLWGIPLALYLLSVVLAFPGRAPLAPVGVGRGVAVGGRVRGLGLKRLARDAAHLHPGPPPDLLPGRDGLSRRARESPPVPPAPDRVLPGPLARRGPGGDLQCADRPGRLRPRRGISPGPRP